VTWHNAQRTAVLSVWHGDVCTATFQLPSEDAARLIAHLADGLAEMAAEQRPESPERPNTTRNPSRLVALWVWARDAVRGRTH
jgi:hypothetical protein